LSVLQVSAFKTTVKMPVGARRTQSLPSKYMLPSETMGEYDSGAQRRKSAPSKPPSGGLFPLDEEGTYGRPPAGPAPKAPPTPKRERKPKIYSSYAVDSACNLHAKKLAKVEKQRERELEEQRSRRRRSMAMANRRNVSASPSRASSEVGSRSSKSPDPSMPPRNVENGYARRKSGEMSRKSSSNMGYSQNSASSTRYSTSSNSSYKFSGIREESEEYMYEENRKFSGYSKYANDGLSNGMGGMSLDGLRKANIDSWDSMGILGLSSKMWNDTRKKQENFMSSTGQFLREEHNSYIM